MNHAALALATLRRLGPMTASELMHATGVSSTTLRRYLVPPRVVVVGERGKGRERAKVYGLTKGVLRLWPARSLSPAGWHPIRRR